MEEADANHDENLIKLLDRAREVNLKLNSKKMNLKKSKVKFSKMTSLSSATAIFVIRENKIFLSVNRDPLVFKCVNRARDPPSHSLYDPI